MFFSKLGFNQVLDIMSGNSEVLESVLKNLTLKDISSLQRTCKSANAMITASDFWKNKAAFNILPKLNYAYNKTGANNSLHRTAKIFNINKEIIGQFISEDNNIVEICGIFRELAKDGLLTKENIESIFSLQSALSKKKFCEIMAKIDGNKEQIQAKLNEIIKEVSKFQKTSAITTIEKTPDPETEPSSKCSIM